MCVSVCVCVCNCVCMCVCSALCVVYKPQLALSRRSTLNGLCTLLLNKWAYTQYPVNMLESESKVCFWLFYILFEYKSKADRTNLKTSLEKSHFPPSKLGFYQKCEALLK